MMRDMSCSRSTASTETAAIAHIGLTLDRRASGARARSVSAAMSLSTRNERLSTCDCGSHELRLDGDVAVRRPRIRTHLVRRFDQALPHVRRDPGPPDFQADRDLQA